MRRLLRATCGWYASVLSGSVVVRVIAFGLLGGALAMLASHHLIWEPWAYRLRDYSEPLKGYVVMLSILSGFYGMMRGFTFHPALDFRYHNWLKASPWSPGAPLPKGPITPVWQDALLLTALTLCTTVYASQTASPNATALGPTIGFAAGLAVSWSFANFVTRNLAAVYGVLLVAPLAAIPFSDHPESAIAVGLVAAAGVAYLGVMKGLKGYPWQVFPKDREYLKRVLNPHELRQVGWQTRAVVGWPYMQMLKPPKDYRVSWRRTAVEAATAFAWVLCLSCLLSPPNRNVVWMGAGQFAFALAVGKLIFNAPLMCPKLCLGERLARRRPFIWRHDRLLLEPLAIIAGVSACGSAWMYLGLGAPWLGAALSVALTVCLFRRFGRPVDERFYAGAQMIQGVAPNAAFFKRLAAPGE